MLTANDILVALSVPPNNGKRERHDDHLVRKLLNLERLQDRHGQIFLPVERKNSPNVPAGLKNNNSPRTRPLKSQLRSCDSPDIKRARATNEVALTEISENTQADANLRLLLMAPYKGDEEQLQVVNSWRYYQIKMLARQMPKMSSELNRKQIDEMRLNNNNNVKSSGVPVSMKMRLATLHNSFIEGLNKSEYEDDGDEIMFESGLKIEPIPVTPKTNEAKISARSTRSNTLSDNHQNIATKKPGENFRIELKSLGEREKKYPSLATTLNSTFEQESLLTEYNELPKKEAKSKLHNLSLVEGSASSETQPQSPTDFSGSMCITPATNGTASTQASQRNGCEEFAPYSEQLVRQIVRHQRKKEKDFFTRQVESNISKNFKPWNYTEYATYNELTTEQFEELPESANNNMKAKLSTLTQSCVEDELLETYETEDTLRR